MKLASLLLAFIPLSLMAQQIPVPIAIQNPSFEQPSSLSPDTCGPWSTSIPGWVSTGSTGVFRPANPNPCDISLPPDGQNVAYVQNGTISQDLGDVYTILPHDAKGEVNGIYTVHLYVANRFYWYNGKFSASLVLKPNSSPYSPTQEIELCKTSGWAMGDFVDVPFTCTAQRKYGELFIILASGTGTSLVCGNCYQNLFDNVLLTFIPSN